MKTHGGKEEGLNVCPEFIKLTELRGTFNLWFEASRPIMDYLKADSAASNCLGWAMLQQALEVMEVYWQSTRRITRNPNICFIFKRPGR